MRLYGLKIPVIGAVFALSLGVAVAAQRLYVLNEVNRPAIERLRQVEPVTDVRLLNGAAGPVLEVDLGETGDFRAVSRQLVQSVVGNGLRVNELLIRDQRSPQLEEALYRMHYAIQEAIASGRFVAMAEQIDALAQQSGIDWHRVYVEEEAIYVQLHDGGAYLYSRIPRPAAGRPAEPLPAVVTAGAGGGGDR